MSYFEKKNWCTGSGQVISFPEIVTHLKEYVSGGSKIFIGSDSFISNKKICFSTAVCLYGSTKPSRYFFIKQHTPKKDFSNLVSRITEETRRSIEIACLLMGEHQLKRENIELHLDVSPTSEGNATSKYSEMLKGYIQGYGINCKLKPFAWASQSVADRHSK